MWLVNLIRPSGANLTEWGWDMSGSRLLIKGVLTDGPALTDSQAFVMEQELPSQPGLPISAVPPFSLTGPFSTQSLLLSFPLPSYPLLPAHSAHLPLFCPAVLSFMVRLQSRLHQFTCQSLISFDSNPLVILTSHICLFFLFSHLSCQAGKDPEM